MRRSRRGARFSLSFFFLFLFFALNEISHLKKNFLTLLHPSCLRVLTVSAPREAQAVACSALSAACGASHRHLFPAVAFRLSRAVRAALLASGSGDGNNESNSPCCQGAEAAAAALLRQVRSGCLAPTNLELAAGLCEALCDVFDRLLESGCSSSPSSSSSSPPLHLLQAGLLASLRLLPELGRARATGSVAGMHPAADAAAAAAGALARRALLVRREGEGEGRGGGDENQSLRPLPKTWLRVVEPCGRDLVRALQDGAASGGAPELERVWQALLSGELPGDVVDLSSAGGGSASFPGGGFASPSPAASPAAGAFESPAPESSAALDPLGRILATRTPPRLLLSRLPPDAEASLYFMLTSVRFASHRRHQQWYMQRHVLRDSNAGGVSNGQQQQQQPELLDHAAAAAAADAAVVDATRYVVGVLHLDPSAESALRAGDVFPRWAALGWLLAAPRTAAGAAGVRAAAMLDWVFFNPPLLSLSSSISSSSSQSAVQGMDSLRSIEPAALCALKSLPRYAQITNGLLEFAALAAEHLSPRHARNLAARGLAAGADAMVARKVVTSLERLATAPEIPAALRERVRAMFPGHCGGGAPPAPAPAAPPQPPPPPPEQQQQQQAQPQPPPPVSTPTWSAASDFPGPSPAASSLASEGGEEAMEATPAVGATASSKRARSPTPPLPAAEAAEAAATAVAEEGAVPAALPFAAAPDLKRRKVGNDDTEEAKGGEAAAPAPPVLPSSSSSKEEEEKEEEEEEKPPVEAAKAAHAAAAAEE